MIDWSEIGRDAVQNSKDENGNSFLIQFVKDYKTIFGIQEMNIGCQSCITTYFNKLTKFQKKMKNSKATKTKARLLKKYEGIQLHFGSKYHITNENITEEQAQYLLKKHPHGAKLFDVLPEVKEKTLKQMTKKELVAKYPDIDSKLSIPKFILEVEKLTA